MRAHALIFLLSALLILPPIATAYRLDLGLEYQDSRHQWDIGNFSTELDKPYSWAASRLEFEKRALYLVPELEMPHRIGQRDFGLRIRGGYALAERERRLKDSDWTDNYDNLRIYSESRLELEESYFFSIEENLRNSRLISGIGYRLNIDRYSAYDTEQVSDIPEYSTQVAGNTIDYKLERHNLYYRLGYNVLQTSQLELGIAGRLGGVYLTDRDEHLERDIQFEGEGLGYLYGVETSLELDYDRFVLRGSARYEQYRASGEQEQYLSSGGRALVEDYEAEGRDTSFSINFGYRF